MLNTAYDAAMPRRSTNRGHPRPCYWWNNEIRELRSACFKARRRAQRTRGRQTWRDEQVRYEDLRNQLKKAIKRSKKLSFQRICQDADINPFGTAYKVVCKNIRAQKQPRLGCPLLLWRIISTLFPQGQPYTVIMHSQLEAVNTIPEVTREELLVACAKIGDKKTPGPDGIPNKALKVAIQYRPDIFVDMFQKCLTEGIFPYRWKEQKLVLVPKPGKPPGEPSSYRPVCLLDTMAKILERLIYDRLLTYAEAKGALSDLQYGFRKGRSTVDALRRVVNIAENAIEGERWKYGTKEYCAVVTLDIKNAFNSVCWGQIAKTLQNWYTAIPHETDTRLLPRQESNIFDG